MCKPPPGPRCAAHAHADLVAARRRAEAALTTLTQAQASGDDEGLVRVEQSQARVDVHTARTQARRAVQEAQEAQRVYDATPTGQRELDAQIAAADRDGRTEEAARVRTRLRTAQAYRDAVMQRWRASSAYAEERLAALLHSPSDPDTVSSDRVSALRDEISRRRCAEQSVLPPPTHPKAHTTWQTTDRHGRIWRLLADQVGEADASLTFADPLVRRAADRHQQEPSQTTCDALLAAHAAAMPAPLVGTDDAVMQMHRATGNGVVWTVDGDRLVDMVAAQGEPMCDAAGQATGDAQPGDEWSRLRLTGPVRVINAAGSPVTGDDRRVWICVRPRDRVWRLLTVQQQQQRFDMSPCDGAAST